MSKTHVPAWKRVGLKLKYAKDDRQHLYGNGIPDSDGASEPPAKKRRVNDSTNPEKGTVTRSSLADATIPSKSTHLEKPKKQVSFTNDTKTKDGDTAVSVIPSEQVEEAFSQAASKKAKKTKQPSQPSATKSQTTLDYLVQFYSSHSSWKFNKNREVWILKHALSLQDIPSEYNLMLAQYIHGLKSQNTRSRLRQECIASNVNYDAPGISQAAMDALKTFPDHVESQTSAVSQKLQSVGRAQLIMWALNPSGGPNDVQTPPTEAAAGKSAVQKKRKNRTAVVEYSSSSSSESESGGDAESESDTSSSEEKSDSDA